MIEHPQNFFDGWCKIEGEFRTFVNHANDEKRFICCSCGHSTYVLLKPVEEVKEFKENSTNKEKWEKYRELFKEYSKELKGGKMQGNGKD
jgi:hypothetical protein